MNKMQINRIICAGFVLLFSSGTILPAFAQQNKPAAKAVPASQKAAVASSPAICSGKNRSCCKGTPSRYAVLAQNSTRINHGKRN